MKKLAALAAAPLPVPLAVAAQEKIAFQSTRDDGIGEIHVMDTELFSNSQHFYRMRAYNVGGTSDYTGVVSARTLRK